MLRFVSKIDGFTALAKDGEIGKAREFLFDDKSWTIRYLVLNTGGWLTERLVLISPTSLNKPLWEEKNFPIDLTKGQIESSPEISEKQPVSRQHEVDLAKYYNWPDYWSDVGGAYIPGAPATMGMPPLGATRELSEKENEMKKDKNYDPNLRSTNEVIGYNIHATDGDIGHVDDIIFEEDTWRIKYIKVDTRNWLPGGKKVLIAVEWIKDVNWAESKVYVDLTKEMIKESPELDASSLNRDYEKKLYEHYGKPVYWK